MALSIVIASLPTLLIVIVSLPTANQFHALVPNTNLYALDCFAKEALAITDLVRGPALRLCEPASYEAISADYTIFGINKILYYVNDQSEQFQYICCMVRGGAVYIMTNKNNTTLYTGVTSDLRRRVYSHKNMLFPDSFTAKYKLFKLVYYEAFVFIDEAIAREKQLKAGSRAKKEKLINSMNPSWNDLYPEIMER